MRRNDQNSLLFGYTPSSGVICMAVLVVFFLFPILALAQGEVSSYQVLSSTASELIIRVAPSYTFDPVTTESGDAVRIRFAGGTTSALAGAPAEMSLSLSVLLPSNTLPSVEVLSEHYETRSIKLAPVPKPGKVNDILVPEYVVHEEAYRLAAPKPSYQFTYTGIVRTAHTAGLNFNAVRYEAGEVRLIKELTVRIHFADRLADAVTRATAAEKEYFEAIFVNGSVERFYEGASAAIAKVAAHHAAFKQSPTATEEKWISIKATDEGVYRITAEQLSGYGITSPDPATIALYGFGGKVMNEEVDSASGELAEVAIDVRTAGGAFQELRFYTPGVDDWRYSDENGSAKYHQIYHIKNPYSGTGHFLLKVGGPAAERRVVDKSDVVTNTPVQRTTLAAMALYENELRYEFPNYSREFVGEAITRGSTLAINLPKLPGYTPDSTFIRPATNSRTTDTQSHSYEFKVNSTLLGTYLGSNYDPSYNYSERNWGTEFMLSPSAGTPTSLSITVSSNDQQPQFWLNFVEIYYQRQLNFSDGQILFFLANDASSYRISIPAESGAELWDITDARNTFRLATTASSLAADLQGPGKAMRRFIAFRESDLKTPELSSTNALTLRPGICQTGAELLIITPEAFKAEAERLAEQRRRGGQATEPIANVAVITVEDIYKEFGYGARDVSAIRDFLAYTLRHTIANNSIKPVHVALFGKGHTDYQNRVTQMPLGIPIYEVTDFGSAYHYRTSQPSLMANIPDDAFFVRLVPRTNPKILDMAPGRIAVASEEEAAAFVDKMIKYETSSDIGSWRARTAFIADDWYYDKGFKVKDPLPHLEDTESEIRQMDKRLTVEKLYSLTYPNTISSTGARFKPELENAIVDAFNQGSVLMSFIGHGNPNVWTHESILKVPSTINKLSNFNRLTYLTTATCDFTAFDNYAEVSGGIMLFIKPDGGIIGSLGTSRSVFGGEELAWEFYKKLFTVDCKTTGHATTSVGIAYLAGRAGGSFNNSEKFYLLGDPSQRLLIPRQYVIFDSINGMPYTDNASTPYEFKALSQVEISGVISLTCDPLDYDPTFNGSASITLKDAPTRVTQVTSFINDTGGQWSVTDRWNVEGPILYRGAATVTNGRFRVRFVVPKDIKFDSVSAKLQALAYSTDFRSALGAATNINVFGTDTSRTTDSEGPVLSIYIGNRRFKSGDVVPVHSKIIVDIRDGSGINTSTSSIGHSFAGWINDSLSGLIDLSETYVSKQDDYTIGTAEQQAVLPLGRNTLHVRAFDALNNPAEGSVEFIARDADPYELYDVLLTSNPVRDGTTFTFLQPSSPQNPVDVTIMIYTVDGRRVRTLTANGVTANDVRVPWDVRDDGGVLVADAAYVYRIVVQDRVSGESTRAGGVFVVQKQ